MKNWKKVSAIGTTQIGATLFRNYFKMCPEVMDYFNFSKDTEVKKKEFLDLGTKMASKINEFISSLSDPSEAMKVCQTLKDIHVSISITPT